MSLISMLPWPPPAPPDFNVDWQNIFRAEPSAQCSYFNIEIGGAGVCTKMASAFGSCGRETFELAKFRPSTVSAEGRCTLAIDKIDDQQRDPEDGDEDDGRNIITQNDQMEQNRASIDLVSNLAARTERIAIETPLHKATGVPSLPSQSSISASLTPPRRSTVEMKHPPAPTVTIPR